MDQADRLLAKMHFLGHDRRRNYLMPNTTTWHCKQSSAGTVLIFITVWNLPGKSKISESAAGITSLWRDGVSEECAIDENRQ
jgi:hypothetical protein